MIVPSLAFHIIPKIFIMTSEGTPINLLLVHLPAAKPQLQCPLCRSPKAPCPSLLKASLSAWRHPPSSHSQFLLSHSISYYTFFLRETFPKLSLQFIHQVKMSLNWKSVLVTILFMFVSSDFSTMLLEV